MRFIFQKNITLHLSANHHMSELNESALKPIGCVPCICTSSFPFFQIICKSDDQLSLYLQKNFKCVEPHIQILSP